ncbi:MAG: hypothetical protein B6I20_05915 [Bacteroidetes bacterium 4572_117]|nr:MAG: hypothetical protein B6I20_05915 [Bacteroidetes bacterium 4572_117]
MESIKLLIISDIHQIFSTFFSTFPINFFFEIPQKISSLHLEALIKKTPLKSIEGVSDKRFAHVTNFSLREQNLQEISYGQA